MRCNLLNDKDKQKHAVCGKLCFIEKRKVKKNAKIQLILKNKKLAEKMRFSKHTILLKSKTMKSDEDCM